MQVKRCSKCQKEKEYSEFPKDKTRPDGYGYMCKECKKEMKAAYRKNAENLKKIKEYNKKYHKAHKDKK